MPKPYKGGRPRGPKSKPEDEPFATSIRLTQRQIDFLRDEAAQRNWFSYKYPDKGAVSKMIIDLIEQFYIFVHGQPKKIAKKRTIK